MIRNTIPVLFLLVVLSSCSQPPPELPNSFDWRISEPDAVVFRANYLGGETFPLPPHPEGRISNSCGIRHSELQVVERVIGDPGAQQLVIKNRLGEWCALPFSKEIESYLIIARFEGGGEYVASGIALLEYQERLLITNPWMIDRAQQAYGLPTYSYSAESSWADRVLREYLAESSEYESVPFEDFKFGLYPSFNPYAWSKGVDYHELIEAIRIEEKAGGRDA